MLPLGLCVELVRSQGDHSFCIGYVIEDNDDIEEKKIKFIISNLD